MKGSEKCSRKGTVKLTLVTSNLHMTRKVPSGLRQGLSDFHLLTRTETAVRTPASQEPVMDQARR